MRKWIATAVLLGLLAGGLWWWRAHRPLDYRPVTDARVSQIHADSTLKDGIEFLQQGGAYADRDPSQKGLDEQLVLPLLERLRSELGHRPQAVLMDDDPTIAGLMTLRLPNNPEQVEKLKQFFSEADAEFDGVILHQYGHHWMHFDFVSAENAAVMEIDNWEVE